MTEAVRIDFMIGGVADVMSAFDSIEKRMVRAEKGATTFALRESRTRVDTAGKEAKDRARITEKERKEREATYTALFKQIDKAEKLATQATDKAEKDRVKSVERAAKEKIAIWKRADAMQSAAIKAGVRETEAAEREKNAIAAKWVRKTERDRRASYQNNVRFARSIGGAVNGGIGNVVSGAGRLAAGAFAVGGGFSIADSVHRSMALEKSAVGFSNSAYVPGVTTRAQVDPKRISAEARRVGIATGMKAEDLVEGTRGYVAKSSDFKGGMANMEFFAKLAKATDTKFEDVTGMAGLLRAQNSNLDDKGMKSMLMNVVSQGKQGSVEVSDLAKAAGSITKTSAMYGMNQSAAQRELLGLSQIAARTSGGSVQEAATEISNLGGDALKHHKEINKKLGAGRAITDSHGDLIAPSLLAKNVMEATGGNMGKIQEMGFGQRSMKFFEALAPSFKDGGSAGMMKSITDITGSKYDQKDMDQDFATVMSTSSEKFSVAVEKIEQVIQGRLTPWINKMADALERNGPELEKFVNKLADVAEWLGQNPWKGLGLVVAGSITSELAKVALGEAVKATILRMIAGGGSPLPTGGGGGGALPKALAVVGAGAAGAELGKVIVDNITDTTQAGQRAASDQKLSDNALSRQKHMTPEQIARAKDRQKELAKEIGERKGSMGQAGSFGEAALGAIANIVDSKGAQEAQNAAYSGQVQQLKAMQAAMGDLVKSIRESEAALKTGKDSPNSPSRTTSIAKQ